jgi:glycine/D-amino acid oxidase-like deaminating enzyme
MKTYDAIVLGAGGVGSAALYQLASRGAHVLGLDRFTPPHDRGSSHGQSRISGAGARRLDGTAHRISCPASARNSRLAGIGPGNYVAHAGLVKTLVAVVALEDLQVGSQRSHVTKLLGLRCGNRPTL